MTVCLDQHALSLSSLLSSNQFIFFAPPSFRAPPFGVTFSHPYIGHPVTNLRPLFSSSPATAIISDHPRLRSPPPDVAPPPLFFRRSRATHRDLATHASGSGVRSVFAVRIRLPDYVAQISLISRILRVRVAFSSISSSIFFRSVGGYGAEGSWHRALG